MVFGIVNGWLKLVHPDKKSSPIPFTGKLLYVKGILKCKLNFVWSYIEFEKFVFTIYPPKSFFSYSRKDSIKIKFLK